MIEAISSQIESRWLETAGRTTCPAIVVGADQDPSAKVTYLFFDGSGRPAVVAKVGRDAAGDPALIAEFEVLRRLQSRGSGVVRSHVPRPLSLGRVDGRSVLFETAVSGEPMTRRYYTPGHTKTLRRVSRDFETAGRWLTRFQEETRSESRILDRQTLEEWALGTFDRYRVEIGWSDEEEALLDAIRQRASDFIDHPMPVTAVHGDYWMGNLMVVGSEVTGVVDWERGQAWGFPFSDIYKFPTSYGFYLDRAYPGRGGRVPGHPGRADGAARWSRFGSWPNLLGFAYAYFGTGWFPGLIREHITERLQALDLPTSANAVFFPVFLADQAMALPVPEFRAGYRSLLRAFWHERDNTWLWNERLRRRPSVGSSTSEEPAVRAVTRRAASRHRRRIGNSRVAGRRG